MQANVQAWCEEGRRKWPHIGLSIETFSRFLAERLDDDGSPPTEAIGSDLYLACGCVERDQAALRAFTDTFSAEINAVAARASAPGVSADDARQILLERILVGTDGSPAKIGTYRGRGSLRGWVRVTAVRLLIDIFRSGGQGREVSVEQSILEEITDSGDPEITYLKKHYRSQFGAAFEAAVAAVDTRTKNYLRHLFVERLTIDQLASLYGVHRSTAARRMAAARDDLLEQTRSQLSARLSIENSEIDSIMRLIASRMEVSIERIFAETG